MLTRLAALVFMVHEYNRYWNSMT